MPFAVRRPVTLPPAPVLVIALEGWIDAGLGAATAASTILDGISTETFLTFDGDELIDQRARRPRLRIDDGVRGAVSWPEPRLGVGVDSSGSGIAVLSGPEPDYRWRAFAAEVRAVALELRARLVVGLGAFPTAVPHTFPIRLASTASSELLARTVGFVPGSLDVPAGIADVIGAECADAGIPSVGLWAKVPHYVAGMPFAPAALALVEGLIALSGLEIDTSELRERASAARRRVDELIAESEEHLEMVRHLEEQVAEATPSLGELAGSIPSGDEIADELERYLRDEWR